jgi:hypothetical protein
MLMGFFEDYQKIIINAKQELVLLRAQNDTNCIISAAAVEPVAQSAGSAGVAGVPVEQTKIVISKVTWRVPHIKVSDSVRLQLFKHLQEDRPIEMGFRSWKACEMPLSLNTNSVTWQVRSTTHVERPRYVLLALQTGKRNLPTKDAFDFDHCKINNVKLFLNDECFPNSDLDINFPKKDAAILFEMFCEFQASYYGTKNKPMLTHSSFIERAPIIIIDCTKQEDAVKVSGVDVRIRFDAEENFPADTTAFCVILHDKVVEYTPLTNRRGCGPMA